MKYFSRIITFLILPSVCAAQNQPPKFRLPTSVVPVRYSIELTVVPDKDTFNGTVDIDLNYKVESSVLWLNAEKLTVKSVPLGEAMGLVPNFVSDPNRDVVTKTLDIVGNLDDHLIPSNDVLQFLPKALR